MWFDIKKYNREVGALRLLKDNPPELNPLRQQALKEQLFSRLGSTSGAPSTAGRGFSLFDKKLKVFPLVLTILIALGMSTGTVLASSSALPGDILYPVKRLEEKIELKLASNPQVHARVRAKHAEVRLEELSQLEVQAETKTSGEAKTRAEEREQRAASEAGLDLETTLNALSEVQIKFENEGQAAAATSISNVIKRLTDRATQRPNSRFEVEHEEEEGRTKVRVRVRPFIRQENQLEDRQEGSENSGTDGSPDSSGEGDNSGTPNSQGTRSGASFSVGASASLGTTEGPNSRWSGDEDDEVEVGIEAEITNDSGIRIGP
ncbi:MAG: DUF5667 domain-containing protein [Candidatus Veblenbacteria bacterium]|nr:DUF5667 domain-containing protein [Candidatus Veblenbacteria bacterium]